MALQTQRMENLEAETLAWKKGILMIEPEPKCLIFGLAMSSTATILLIGAPVCLILHYVRFVGEKWITGLLKNTDDD